METLVRILIISDDESFVARLRDLVSHPQVSVECALAVPDDKHHFYVLGEQNISDMIDRVRQVNEGSPIYLAGSACEVNVPLIKMIKCNIVDCIKNEEGMRIFAKRIDAFRKQRSKMREASCKLDCLKAGDLKTLAHQMKRTESERFVDYIQNHPLPMVLVSCDGEVLHANESMENLIGTKLPGMVASHFWADPDKFEETSFDLKEEGQLLGREVTLKNIDGDQMRLKLYSSLHHDAAGNWLNTRCLFVPCD